METARPLIIVNPTAGHARRAWPVVRGKLDAAGLVYDFYETRGAGDATARARAALRENCTTIAALGGDGTLGETAQGFFNPDTDEPQIACAAAVFAPLPAGTGNDFTRALAGGRPAPLEKWVEALAARCRGERQPRAVDVLFGQSDGGAQRFIALNAVTLGLSVETILRVRSQGAWLRRLPGEARFVAAALGALAAWRERAVRVVLDDGAAREFTTNLLVFSNTRYAGGGMMFAPNAQPDDGWFDALLTAGLARRHILRELPRIRAGGHVANPRVTIQQTRHARVEGADGAQSAIEADSNPRGATPLELSVRRGALKVVAPHTQI